MSCEEDVPAELLTGHACRFCEEDVLQNCCEMCAAPCIIHLPSYSVFLSFICSFFFSFFCFIPTLLPFCSLSLFFSFAREYSGIFSNILKHYNNTCGVLGFW